MTAVWRRMVTSLWTPVIDSQLSRGHMFAGRGGHDRGESEEATSSPGNGPHRGSMIGGGRGSTRRVRHRVLLGRQCVDAGLLSTSCREEAQECCRQGI